MAEPTKTCSRVLSWAQVADKLQARTTQCPEHCELLWESGRFDSERRFCPASSAPQRQSSAKHGSQLCRSRNQGGCPSGKLIHCKVLNRPLSCRHLGRHRAPKSKPAFLSSFDKSYFQLVYPKPMAKNRKGGCPHLWLRLSPAFIWRLMVA